MRIIDITLAVFCSFLWGTNAVVSKIGMQDMSPLFLATMRFAIILPFTCFLAFPEASPLTATDPTPSITGRLRIIIGLTIVGLLSSIQFCAMNLGIHLGVSAGVIALLVQVGVIFNYLLSWFVFKTPPTRGQLIGVSVALVGLFILSGDIGKHFSLAGLLLGLLGAICYGSITVLLKWAKPKNITSFTAAHNAVAFLSLIPLNFILWEGGAITPRAILCIIYAGLISNLLGTVIWTNLLKRYDQTAKVMQFTTLVPIFGIFSGVAFLGEFLTERMIIAAFMVFTGLLIGQGTIPALAFMPGRER